MKENGKQAQRYCSIGAAYDSRATGAIQLVPEWSSNPEQLHHQNTIKFFLGVGGILFLKRTSMQR